MKDTDQRIWPIGLPANHEVPSSRPALSRRRARVKRRFTRVELRDTHGQLGTTSRSEDTKDAVYRVMGRHARLVERLTSSPLTHL